MVTKGIIEELQGYKALVRLPVYDDIYGSRYGTKKENLPSATYCSVANIQTPLSIGDVVYVAFEDNDMSKPVIIGHLYRKAGQNAEVGLQLSTLSTDSTTKLSTDTWIGKVTPNELASLSKITGNIQAQIDNINKFVGNVDAFDIAAEAGFVRKLTEKEVNGKKIQNHILSPSDNGIYLASEIKEEDILSSIEITPSRIYVDGNLQVTGDIIQNDGKNIYEVQKERIKSKNDFILLRDGNPAKLNNNEYSGLKIQNVDGSGKNTLLVVDNQGIARVGIEDNEKGIQALATRNDTMYNEGIAVWNSEKNRLDNFSTVTAKENQIKIGKCTFKYDGDTDSIDFIWE